MAFQCIPLNPDWTGTTKLDLRAVYKRANGDLTTALPLRRHNDWLKKGLEYVTLADAESFNKALPHIRAAGLNPQDYVVGVDGDGLPTPWNVSAYLADQRVAQGEADKELAALIAAYGVEAVERITGKPVPLRLRQPEHETAFGAVTEAPDVEYLPATITVTPDPVRPRRGRPPKVTA